MTLKKCFLFICFSGLLWANTNYAQPNTVTVTGTLNNQATINDSVFKYVNARISIENPEDAAYVKVANGTIPPNFIFNLEPNNNTPYSIEISNIKGNVHVWLYDPNYNVECQWRISPGVSFIASLERGAATYCAALAQNFIISRLK